MFGYALLIYAVTKIIIQSTEWETIVMPGKILGIQQMDTIDPNCQTILRMCASRTHKEYLRKCRNPKTRFVYTILLPTPALTPWPEKLIFTPFFYGPRKYLQFENSYVRTSYMLSHFQIKFILHRIS